MALDNFLTLFTFSNLRYIFSSLQFQDIFDILFTAFLIYLLFWFLRRTKSLPVIFGVLIFLIVYLISYSFRFSLTYKILQTFIGAFIVVLVIIFQEEIKRFFYFLGSVKFKKIHLFSISETLNTLGDTIFMMANRKIGALIVLLGKESIDPYVSGGIEINAKISPPLILSIFNPSGPAHDGALIIEGNEIKKFGVYLPLSKDLKQLKNYGTRHRAGLGISEKTDSLCVIVSEEKGTVSVAQDGVFKNINDKSELKETLSLFFSSLTQEPNRKIAKGIFSFIKRNVLLAVASLIVSFLMWLGISYPNLGIIQKNFIVPIELTNVNSNYVVENLKPLEVDIL